MMFDYGEPKKQWIAYDNGSYEPVDPQGDLRKKPRDDRKLDWWVEDKTPDWRPDTYADTKRGKQARQELGGTRTMEQKPFFTQQPEEQDESVFVQPQHRNTGHASVRLGGPEDGKVTLLGSDGGSEKAPAGPDHPQPVGGLARAERKQRKADMGVGSKTSDRAFLNQYKEKLGGYIGASDPAFRALGGERLEREFSGPKAGWGEALTPEHGLLGTVATGQYKKGDIKVVVYPKDSGEPGTWEVLEVRETDEYAHGGNKKYDWTPVEDYDLRHNKYIQKALTDIMSNSTLHGFEQRKYKTKRGEKIE